MQLAKIWKSFVFPWNKRKLPLLQYLRLHVFWVLPSNYRVHGSSTGPIRFAKQNSFLTGIELPIASLNNAIFWQRNFVPP